MAKSRHKYEYRADPNAGNTAASNVVRMVGKDKRVLEIGAGPGSITRLLKDHGNCRVTAIELDEKAIATLSPFCERVYQCDLNDPDWPAAVSGGEKFQAVVAADVLEHLYDPWSTLGAIKTILDDDGHVVVSLPHVGHCAVLACLLEEDFAYQHWGLLDKTHIRFFGIENIQRLFNDAGFQIVEAEFVVREPERTEFANRWRRLPEEVKRSLAYNRFGMVYQVVVKAKAASLFGKGLRLSELPVPAPGPALPPGASLRTRAVYRLKQIVLPYLSPEARTRIVNILSRLGVKL